MEKQRGGKREGAVGKPLLDRKKQVSCYFLESDILALGKSECQKIAQKLSTNRLKVAVNRKNI
jgi:hypothetical protein